jgi:hypothetical protein
MVIFQNCFTGNLCKEIGAENQVRFTAVENHKCEIRKTSRFNRIWLMRVKDLTGK